MTGECIYCGQACELAADGAWVDVDSGRSGCGLAVEAGERDGEHVVEEVSGEELLGTTDAGYEERILDAQVAAAEIGEEV